MLDSLFSGLKIKKLIDELANAGTQAREAEVVAELAGFGRQAVKLTVESLQHRKLPAQKALGALERLADDSCLEEFLPLLGDSYDEIRRVAKELIHKRWKKAAVPHLVELLGGANFYAQTNAADLLAGSKDPSCVGPLISLYNQATPETKKFILKILSNLDDHAGHRLIISALYDKVFPVRMFAVRCLSRMRDPESVAPLVKKLSEADDQLTKLVIEALTAIGDKRAALPVLPFLSNPDLLVRQAATDCLIALDNPEVVPAIIKLMKSDDVNARRCGVEVLNNLKDPRTSEILLHAIKDADWWVRQVATDALAEIKGEAVVQGFVAMLGDRDENVRRCAVEFFNVVAVPSAFDALLGLLDDPDWWVRQKAVLALSKLGNDRAVAPLLGMLDDREVSWVVPMALAGIGGPAVEASLRELLAHPEKHIRKDAVKALTSLKPASASSDLMKCLADPDAEVRAEAVASLKILTGKVYREEAALKAPVAGPPDAIPSLRPPAGTDTLTEAILVLDVCGSTEKVSRYGDKYFLELMKKITGVVRPVAQQEKVHFLKGTGDGFLMTFPTVVNAVSFARQVLGIVNKSNAAADESGRIALRFAVHFGETKVDPQGDRLGANVSMTFRVDGVHPEALIPMAHGMTADRMPTRNRILLTENAEAELRGHVKIVSAPVGLFELKGIPGLHRLFAVTV